MAGAEWDERLNTGDAVVDRQHAEFHSLVTHLGEMPQGEENRRMLEAMLFQILRHAAVHFSAEEALMRRISYPGLDRQRRLHTEFAGQITSMAGAYMDDSDTVTVQAIQSFMADWLLHHVMEEDLLLAEYIREDSRDIAVRKRVRE